MDACFFEGTEQLRDLRGKVYIAYTHRKEQRPSRELQTEREWLCS